MIMIQHLILQSRILWMLLRTTRRGRTMKQMNEFINSGWLRILQNTTNNRSSNWCVLRSCHHLSSPPGNGRIISYQTKEERSNKKKKTTMTSSVVNIGTDTTSASATKVNDYSICSYDDEAATAAAEDLMSSSWETQGDRKMKKWWGYYWWDNN